MRINDRGPFTHNRIIDLSEAAVEQLDMIADGVANVRVSRVDEPVSITQGTQRSNVDAITNAVPKHDFYSGSVDSADSVVVKVD